MQKLILRFIYSVLLRWFLKVIVGIKFDDARFLLKEDQFIIVANHNSHLDTMSLLASIPGKIIHKVKPVAAEDHFGKTRLQRAFSNYFINTLLIPRRRDLKNPENDPINKMIKTLDDGFSLILFPEGTRGEPEKIQPLKPGVAYVLSQRSKIKYVPAYMTGMGNALPKGDNLIIPFSSTLTYGKPKRIETSSVEVILEQIEGDLKEMKNTKKS